MGVKVIRGVDIPAWLALLALLGAMLVADHFRWVEEQPSALVEASR